MHLAACQDWDENTIRPFVESAWPRLKRQKVTHGQACRDQETHCQGVSAAVWSEAFQKTTRTPTAAITQPADRDQAQAAQVWPVSRRMKTTIALMLRTRQAD